MSVCGSALNLFAWCFFIASGTLNRHNDHCETDHNVSTHAIVKQFALKRTDVDKTVLKGRFLKSARGHGASAATKPCSLADTNCISRIYKCKYMFPPGLRLASDCPSGFVLPVFTLSRRPNSQEPLVFTCRGFEQECAGEFASAWTFFFVWMLFPILGDVREPLKGV